MTQLTRKPWAAAMAALTTALLLAGCTGGGVVLTRHAADKTSGRTMRLKLADASAGPVSAEVPSQPIGSAPTSIPGMTLDLYLVKRARPGAVLVVFGLTLNTTAATAIHGNPSQVVQGLSQNYLSGTANAIAPAVSGVALLDPAGLKEYETFMGNPNYDSTCLCSQIDPGLAGLSTSPGTYYYAAMVAAPPAGVTSVSFVTGLGTIASVPLSG